MKEKMDSDMIKGQPISKEEVEMLREKFVIEYAKKKGWDHKELTTNQMLEIVSQRQYKTPGLILG
jgi:hypothetical protein